MGTFYGLVFLTSANYPQTGLQLDVKTTKLELKRDCHWLKDANTTSTDPSAYSPTTM